jgi:hypothetical protein
VDGDDEHWEADDGIPHRLLHRNGAFIGPEEVKDLLKECASRSRLFVGRAGLCADLLLLRAANAPVSGFVQHRSPDCSNATSITEIFSRKKVAMAARRKKAARSPDKVDERIEVLKARLGLRGEPGNGQRKKKDRDDPAFPSDWNGVSIPKAITAEWIKTAPGPYLGLEAYLLSLLCTAKWGKTDQTVLDALPPAYRMILRLCEFCSDVINGGFVQYLGNKSRNEGIEIVETVEMLRRFGLPEIAKMLRKAIALLGADLPSAVLSTLSKKERERAATTRLSDEELERRINPIDRQFSRIRSTSGTGLIAYVMKMSDLPYDPRYDYIRKANEYIKRHPEEFVHTKLSIQKKPMP